jgi:dihydroxyacetone kinase-like protein
VTVKDIKAFGASLAETFDRERHHLGQLDAALGDGDHGAGMARGFSKAARAMEAVESDDVGSVFQAGGQSFMAGAGGASGPLFATVFLELGKASRGITQLEITQLEAGVRAAAVTIGRLGKAEAGDKTMLDALLPAAEALGCAERSGEPLATALQAAAEAARGGVEATAAMAAKKGRARYVEAAGVGHPDPGATSMALFFETLYSVYREDGGS